MWDPGKQRAISDSRQTRISEDADSVEAGEDSYGNADVMPRGGMRDKTEAVRRVHRYAAYANKYESVELGSRMIYVQKSRTLPSKSCKGLFTSLTGGVSALTYYSVAATTLYTTYIYKPPRVGILLHTRK